MQRAACCLIILLLFLTTGVRADYIDYHSPQIYNSFDSLLKPEEKAMSPVVVFHQCIRNRDHARVRQFIAAGIDINEYVSDDGIYYNALQFAVHNYNFEAVKALVDAGAEVNIRERMGSRYSLLMWTTYFPYWFDISPFLLLPWEDGQVDHQYRDERMMIYHYLKHKGAKIWLWSGYAKNAYFAYAVAGFIVIVLGSFLFTVLICSLFESCSAEVVFCICVGIFASLWVWYGPALLFRFFYIFK